MDALADQLGIDRARVPPSQCAARRRRDGVRPEARPFAPASPMPRGAAAALAEGAGRDRRVQCEGRREAARRRRRLHVVRHRQHLDVEPFDHAGRAGGRRHADALQRRARYRPGQQHHHDPDRGRCARPAGRAVHAGHRRYRSHRRRRQDLGLAPDLRLGQGRRARRPRPAPEDPAARQCRPRCGADARRRDRSRSATAASLMRSISPRSGRCMGEGDVRSADHAARCRRPGRALCDLCLRRPDRRSSRSISSSAR